MELYGWCSEGTVFAVNLVFYRAVFQHVFKSRHMFFAWQVWAQMAIQTVCLQPCCRAGQKIPVPSDLEAVWLLGCAEWFLNSISCVFCSPGKIYFCFLVGCSVLSLSHMLLQHFSFIYGPQYRCWCLLPCDFCHLIGLSFIFFCNNCLYTALLLAFHLLFI